MDLSVSSSSEERRPHRAPQYESYAFRDGAPATPLRARVRAGAPACAFIARVRQVPPSAAAKPRERGLLRGPSASTSIGLFQRHDSSEDAASIVKKPSEGKRDSAASPSPETRRRPDRFSVELEISVTTEHNFYAGFVENLSHAGLFIATHVVRPIGSQVEFSIALDDDKEPIKGLGEVRWIRQYSDTSDAHPGMGLRFLELSPEGRKRIEQFLVGREPIFYDDDL
jgi:uncharacterized protein (TIGR02266 family)